MTAFFARPRRRLAAAFLALALAGVAAARADDDDAPAKAMPSRVTVKDGVTVITLDAAAQQNGGIETALPAPPPREETVAAYASVLDAGAVTELANRYLEAKAAVAGAEAKLAVSRTALERARTLYQDRQNISAAALQGAEGSFAADRAALGAAEARLATVTATAEQGWGTVIAKALVDQTPLAADLIARRSYLVRVTLPLGITIAAAPETASVLLRDGSTVRLRLLSPATTADPRLQGISYFYVAPAAAGLLPGLSLMASLPVAEAPHGVVVPDSAVVWLQGRPWIFLRTGPDTFVRRAIAAEHAAPGGGYLVIGLPADARIAVRGAQMLLSEEFRAEVPVDEDER
jgi:hypothetical protein